VFFAFNDAGTSDKEQIAGSYMNAIDLEGKGQGKILPVEPAEFAKPI